MKCIKFISIFNDKNTFHIMPMLYNYLTKWQSTLLYKEKLFKFHFIESTLCHIK